jgi:hypothetical protein
LLRIRINDAVPDLAFHFDADPDPTFDFDADQDPAGSGFPKMMQINAHLGPPH